MKKLPKESRRNNCGASAEKGSYIPEDTMVTLGLILIMIMIFKMFEGAKVLAKKRQVDEVPEGDPVEGPTSILNGKTTRQELAKKVRFIDEVDVENAKMVQAGSGRRTKLLISKEKRVSPSAPNVHSEEHGTEQTAQDNSLDDNSPATENILDIADLATAGLRRSGRSRKQKVIYDPSKSDGTFSKALAAISSFLTDRSEVLTCTYSSALNSKGFIFGAPRYRPRTKYIALSFSELDKIWQMHRATY